MRSRLFVLVTASLIASLLGLPGGVSAQESDEADAAAIARRHIRSQAESYGVAATDVQDLAVRSAYRSRHTGVTHVNLNQRFQGREVFGADVTVNVMPDGGILFVGGRPRAGLAAAGPGQAELDPAAALEAAADALDLGEPVGVRILRRTGGKTVLTGGGISDEPIPVRLGWQPTEDGLRLAWQLVIDSSSDVSLWNATIDAETGELLVADDWTNKSSVSRLATRLSRQSAATTTSAASAPITTPDPVDDGSSYRVYALAKESPNDGDRSLVTNPADAPTSPFGWHDTDGVPGAEFTTTRGNNVHAYTDHENDNVGGPGEDAEGGPGLGFDFPLELTNQPETYADAAVTNLFYWCNVAHDLFARYGFDEASGNFQAKNYSGQGNGGDDVRCEAQDGGGLNNANFSTPAMDGGRPRMQMYLWSAGTSELPNLVTVDAPSSAAGTYQATGANFGPDPDASGVAGQIVVVDDGTAAPSEGCGSLVGFPAGAIALVDRGSCPFVQKASNAQAAGAVGVIVANNVGGAPITMGGSNSTILIPSVMVSMADGATIKSGLAATGTITSNPNLPPLRDGDLESGIILHEYGHGLSNRLTGGPTVNCLSGAERMSEGWSDYVALAALIDPGLDDPEGPRGMGTYALRQDTPTRMGAGIRPRPYSRNMDIQPFTYDSIKTGAWLNGASLAQPHGVGHGWAAVLWDMTWDLIDKHGFNPNLYEDWSTGGNNLAYQLVFDGLKLQGCAPGFVTGRDAIIAADEALTDGANACTLWASFSRRGLGYSAVQGTSADRDDNAEAFDTHPACHAGFRDPVRSDGLNTVAAGSSVPLRFSAGGTQGPDVLASSFSRQVDCTTLAVPSEGEFITPRARPVDTLTAGGSSPSPSGNGVYRYPWKTLEEWAGTCREVVLTRTDGVQHRAFFRFVEGD